MPLYCRKCGTHLSQDSQFCPACGTSQSLTDYSPTNQFSYGPAGTGRLAAGKLLHQRYRLLRVVGKGGMGAVYLAQDTQLGDRLVAVKEMSMSRLTPRDVPQAIQQFQHEAHLLASLQHPGLPAIYDHFGEESRWYLVMSFIQGQTLQSYLDVAPGHKLPLMETVRIGVELCNVLHYLHTHQPQIIFRDLKPSNVMITPAGNVYLIDFGIARHFKPDQTRDTIYQLSVGYAPPEQYGQAQTGPRSDIYSLGATMHQMLTGHNPATQAFRFPALQLLDPTIPPSLAKLIGQMLEMDEKHRPPTILLVKQELERLLHQPLPAQTDPVDIQRSTSIENSTNPPVRSQPLAGKATPKRNRKNRPKRSPALRRSGAQKRSPIPHRSIPPMLFWIYFIVLLILLSLGVSIHLIFDPLFNVAGIASVLVGLACLLAKGRLHMNSIGGVALTICANVALLGSFVYPLDTAFISFTLLCTLMLLSGGYLLARYAGVVLGAIWGVILTIPGILLASGIVGVHAFNGFTQIWLIQAVLGIIIVVVTNFRARRARKQIQMSQVQSHH